MTDTPRSPAEAKEWLQRLEQQLLEYETGTAEAEELTPYIEPRLVRYARSSIAAMLQGQDPAKAFGLAHARRGAPAKRNQTKNPDDFGKQQKLIFEARILRVQGLSWKEIVKKLRYKGRSGALEKMCRTQADLVEQARMWIAFRQPRQVRPK